MATALIGFVGAILGIMSNYGIEWYRRNQRARSVAAMIASEISAQIEITKIRDYIGYFENLASDISNGNTTSFGNFIYQKPNENPIYDVVKSEIGILGPIFSSNIVSYYMIANAIRVDIKNLAETDLNTSHLPVISRDLKLWKETVANGLRLADKLSKHSRQCIFFRQKVESLRKPRIDRRGIHPCSVQP